ncbi:MAG: 6-bladed beta-propeller [Magnetococcales bacterium]|nr:6-bladed beta-propeller [Magnetococcales bacterium]
MPSSERPQWPPLPEVPRYLYAGQLTGRDNYRMVEQTGSRAEDVMRWVVGLDPESEIGKRIAKGLQRPQSGLVDSRGRIIVADNSIPALLVFDELQGKFGVWLKAGEGKKFSSPVGVAHGPKGEVLVADSQLKWVVRLNPEGEPVGTFGKEVLARPTGLARDAERGIVYVADSQADDIKVFDDHGTLLRTIGKMGEEPGEFNAPTHLTFKEGRLYVSDTLNARVQVFDRQDKLVLTIGQRGLNMGNLVRPKGVAVDGEGHIYVVESFHDYLLVYDSEGRFLMPIGGTGQEVGSFFLPSGLWIDERERVFISDMFNGRVTILQFLGGS